MRLIDFNSRITALIIGFDEIQTSFINDAYSTIYDSKNIIKSVELLKYNDNFENTFTNKIILESIGVSVNCVTAVWCSDVKFNFTAKDDKCIISGTYQANIIYKDAENQTGIIQKPVDFDSSIKMKNKAERITCIGSIQIASCSCAIIGDSKLEMKTELQASGTILLNTTKKYVSEIELLNDNRKKDSCALTICFCDKGESLWNIARKYNTTVNAIKEENNIIENTLVDNCMLLIPANN